LTVDLWEYLGTLCLGKKADAEQAKSGLPELLADLKFVQLNILVSESDNRSVDCFCSFRSPSSGSGKRRRVISRTRMVVTVSLGDHLENALPFALYVNNICSAFGGSCDPEIKRRVHNFSVHSFAHFGLDVLR
jgi:hypothetical protein